LMMLRSYLRVLLDSRSSLLLSSSRISLTGAFLHQNRNLSSSPSSIKKVGVIGLGLMGHGIAQVVAESGVPVVALETQGEFLDRGMSRIKNSLSKISEKKVAKGQLAKDAADNYVTTTFGRINPSLNKQDLKDCDLIVEAILENLDAKKKLAKELSSIVKPGAILASNTSSLSITAIANASSNPSQLVGLHFFNPVQIMNLVEVVRTDKTNEKVFQTTLDFVKSIGKTPVSCKDTPGFIVNRLLVPYLAQALLMLDRNDASKEDIDTAMRLGAGYPMGPIHLLDYVGLDTTLFILEGWVKDYPNEPAFKVPEILRKKVAQGKLGRKTGEGFYKWQGDKIAA